MESELTFGLTDELNVAPLGVGAWAWGSIRLWGYGKEYDRSDVGGAFRASMAEDVTLVDTAEIYGNGASEMDALAETVKAGKVRRVGVSNYGVDQMQRAHDRLAFHGVPLASNQVEYSLLQRAPETNGVLEASRDLGVTLIAYSLIAQRGSLPASTAPEIGPRASCGGWGELSVRRTSRRSSRW